MNKHILFLILVEVLIGYVNNLFIGNLIIFNNGNLMILNLLHLLNKLINKQMK